MVQTIWKFNIFSKNLYHKLSTINGAVAALVLYEFRYALQNLTPANGDWSAVEICEKAELEELINDSSFYRKIKLKPKVNNDIVLDETIIRLTNTLFAGIVKEEYELEWVNRFFYFDVRAFIFIPRTLYLTDRVLDHLGGKPLLTFHENQQKFDAFQGIGYRDFREANDEIDLSLAGTIKKLIDIKGTPLLIGIAGPTAAGKTEFTEYLADILKQEAKKVSSIEMDNFFLDRDYREKTGVGSMGRQSIHFELFKQCLTHIKAGEKIHLPRYDTVKATSSHNIHGRLKEGALPIEVEPTDVIYIEGNFPFLYKDIAHLIDLKIVYLTDDPVRLKRKWKRDIDYRKKYNAFYLCNRYFRTQFLKAQECYLPQLEVCDIAVDTTDAALYVSAEIAEMLGS